MAGILVLQKVKANQEVYSNSVNIFRVTKENKIKQTAVGQTKGTTPLSSWQITFDLLQKEWKCVEGIHSMTEQLLNRIKSNS